MLNAPLLDRDGIAMRIPHRGSMCLLDRLWAWTPQTVHCSASGHGDPAHPMRTASGLLAPCAIEYAAQAMALHGALVAQADGGDDGEPPTPGFIASVRAVRFHVARLDDLPGRLDVHAERLSGDARQVLYGFVVRTEAGGAVAEGRAVVVLNTRLSDAGLG